MAAIGRRGRGGRLRLPLAFVVARYFLYVLVGSLFLAGFPTLAFIGMMTSGGIYAANYGGLHVAEVRAELEAQQAFDAGAIPSAYLYAHLAVDGELLEGDMGGAGLERARSLARAGGSEGDKGDETVLFPSAGTTQYELVSLADGTICVLEYNLMPQWAEREMRETWMNPQDLLILGIGASISVFVGLVAWRAGSVLTRKMAPLVEAAEAVGRQDLDAPVGTSNIAQVDDVLAAMDEMRLSLKRSLEEQIRAEARQREQVAALAHDLKTPLTIIRGNAELLLEDAAAGELGDEQTVSVEAIGAAAQRTDAFVAGIIAASRGAAVAPRLREAAVAEVEDELVRVACSLAEARGAVLAVERSGEAAHVAVDGKELSRAVLNLVGNALDHTLAGSPVRLRFEVHRDTLAIVVEDEGPGFTPEALAHGTERFFRDARARGQEGEGGEPHFGLGLFIAAEVARAHGGELRLENRECGGARATLLLPLSSR